MAKKTKRSAKRKAARHCPPCTAAAMARAEFSHAKRAGSCSGQERALTHLKSEVAKGVDTLSGRARNLAFRELLSKEKAVQSCKTRQESSDANRFNGLLGLGFFGL